MVHAQTSRKGEQMTDNVLSEIKAKIAALSPDQIKEQLAKLQAQKEKQKEYRTGSSKELTPEQKAKRTEYNKNRLAKPEVKEKMKAYRERPDVKAKQVAKRKEKYQFNKALLEKAKELGLTA
jgi:hypothetical protein